MNKKSNLKHLKMGLKIPIVGIVAITGIIVYFTQFQSKPIQVSQAVNDANHPIYSQYQFNNSERVINIGIQPVYMPAGLITEVMKRDRVLKQKLSNLNLKIQYFSFLKGADVNHFMRSGDLDVGVGGDMPFITMVATDEIRSPLKIQEGFVSIVAKNAMLVNQLAGKKIGYAFGSNAHYALIEALSFEDIKETDITLVPMEINDMATALFNGSIDAFSAWEPTPALALKKYPAFVTIRQKLSTGYIYFQANVYEQHPEIVKALCASVIRAVLWMQDNRDNLYQAALWGKREAEHVTSREIPLTANELAELALKDILGNDTYPLITKASVSFNSNLYREFKFLKENKVIPESSRWEKVQTSVDVQIAEELFQKADAYGLRAFDYE